MQRLNENFIKVSEIKKKWKNTNLIKDKITTKQNIKLYMTRDWLHVYKCKRKLTS